MNKEFWELTLPNQAKWRVELLEAALDRFEGRVVATHTSKGYSPPWRAPKVFKIALPAGYRMKFIQHCVAHNKSGTGFHWWLDHPAQLEVPCNKPEPITPIAFARIDRDALSQIERRDYSLGMRDADPYIWDYHPIRGRQKLHGDDVLRFLNGEVEVMDLLLGERS